MFNKHLHFVSVCTLALFGATARAQDAIVPDDFGTIGAALAGATDVDTDGVVEIFVRPGTYAENVRISSSNVLLEGDAAAPPTIQGDGLAHVVYVESFTSGFLANVTLKNLRVTGGGLTRDGVEFSRVNAGVIENVEAFGNAEGLRWNRGTAGAVRQNLTRNNAHSGIKLTQVSAVQVSGNTSHHNADHGIDVGSTFNATFTSNNAHDNGSDGMRIRRGLDLTVQTNLLTDNGDNGARIEFGTRVTFLSNVCDGNVEAGLRTRSTVNCLYSLNQFTNNTKYGVRLRDDVAADFDAAVGGTQGPLGDNTFAGNGNSDVRAD